MRDEQVHPCLAAGLAPRVVLAAPIPGRHSVYTSGLKPRASSLIPQLLRLQVTSKKRCHTVDNVDATDHTIPHVGELRLWLFPLHREMSTMLSGQRHFR